MNITPIFRYPTLAIFEKELARINKQYSSLDLMDLTKVLHILDKTVVNKLVNDLGHGFNHTFFVLELVLNLAESDNHASKINHNLLSCGALLHDVYVVINRKNHGIKGGKLARRIVEENKSDFPNVDPKAIEYIVVHHNEDTNFVWKYDEAKLVRDADTLHEGIDLDRIVWVSQQYGKQFYNPEWRNNVDARLEVLGTEDPSITDEQGCDTLMFLLRNVTKSISPDWFVTDLAKKYIGDMKVLDKNKRQLQSLIKVHVPASEQQEALALVEDVITKFWI